MKKKRIMAGILAILLITLQAPITAFANTESEVIMNDADEDIIISNEETVTVIQEGANEETNQAEYEQLVSSLQDHTGEYLYTYYNQMTNMEKVLYCLILKSYEEKQEQSFSLDGTEFSFSDFYTASEVIKAEHPWLTVANVSYTLNEESNRIYISAEDKYSSHDIAKARSRIDQIVNTMGIGTRYSQIMNLLMFMVKHMEYDSFGLTPNAENIESHSIIGPAVYNIGLCDGFAYLIKGACDQIGIPCLVVAGLVTETSGHAWNYIQMEDGQWYLLDGTNGRSFEIVDEADFYLNVQSYALIGAAEKEADYRYARERGVAIWGDTGLCAPEIASTMYQSEDMSFDYDEKDFNFEDADISFLYSVNEDDSCTITGFDGKEEGDLVIPDELDGHRVSVIGRRAFYHAEGFIGDLFIPDTVEVIEEEAFFSCSGFRGSLHLPANLQRIGTKAFMNCRNFTGELNLPDQLMVIEPYAFLRADSFTGTLVIPASMSDLGWLDYSLSGIEDIQVSEENKSFVSDEGIIYSKDFEEVVLCARSVKGKVVLRPEVRRIAKYAFYQRESVSEVVIPDGTESIGINAFSGCSNLKSVNLPESLVTLGVAAFDECSSLESAVIPGSLQTIEILAFANCSSLRNVTIMEGVKTISDFAFYQCSSLTSVSVPETVRKIGGGAFGYCDALDEVVFGGSQEQWKQLAVDESNIYLQRAYGKQFTDFPYLISGDQAIVLDYVGEASVATVPEKIEGYAVAEVRLISKTESRYPETLIIPSGVGVLNLNSQYAISRWTNLKTIVLEGDTNISGLEFACSYIDRLITVKSSPNHPDKEYICDLASYEPLKYQWEELLTELTIIQQPEHVTAGINTKISFSVTAELAVSYQWQYTKDGKKWTNSTAASAKTNEISITISKSNYANAYRCKLTDKDGTVLYSELAGISLIPWVNVIQQPESPAMIKGETVNFHVEAENVAEGGYQWQYSKDGKSWYKSTAAGNNTDTLSIKVSSTNLSNMYRCAMTGIDGNKAYSGTGVFVIIEEQPQPSTAKVGEYATFSLNAEGVESYQWQYSDDGKKWYTSTASGATTETIRFRATSTNHDRVYRCKLLTGTGVYAYTKPVGFAEGIKIITQPAKVSAAVGDKVIYTVEATGVASYQWQYSKDGKTWYKSGAAGSASASLQITITEGNRNNMYRCKLTGTNGTVEYTVTV